MTINNISHNGVKTTLFSNSLSTSTKYKLHASDHGDYTHPNAKTNTLLPIIWQKVKLTNSIYLKLHCSAHLQVSQITIQCVSCRFFGNPYSLPICALESTQVASSLYYY